MNHVRELAAFYRQPERELRRQVLERLGWLNYHAYAQAIGMLLRSLGYRDVVIAGRKAVHAPTDCGGLDIRATLKSGVSASSVLVQAKQAISPIQRRFVDELRGTMLRVGAGHGLIISTAGFSDKALDAAALYPGCPVRLVSGSEFARLMVRQRLGVRFDPIARHWPKTILDEQYFERLEEKYR